MKIVESGKCGDNVYYELFESGTLEISGEGRMWNLFYSEPNFSQYANITHVVVHDGVTSIGDRVFEDCKLLKSIIFANTIKRIGVNAFANCISLEILEFPQSLRKIREEAFYNCTSISSIIIPKRVRKIKQKAFEGCTALASIEVLSDNIELWDDVFSNTAWFNNQPDGCVYINDMLYRYKGKMPPVAHIDVRKGTTKICNGAFDSCFQLKSVHLPDGLITIDRYAFYYCLALRVINIPNTVKYIKCYAFNHCKTLMDISIPSSVIEIGYEAFDFTFWKNNLPDGCVYVNDTLYGYKYNGWEKPKTDNCLIIKEGITRVNRCDDFEFITFPSTSKEIEHHAFAPYGVHIPKIITCLAVKPPIIKYLAPNVYESGILIRIPKGSKEAYMKHKHWGKFKNIEEIDIDYFC